MLVARICLLSFETYQVNFFLHHRDQSADMKICSVIFRVHAFVPAPEPDAMDCRTYSKTHRGTTDRHRRWDKDTNLAFAICITEDTQYTTAPYCTARLPPRASIEILSSCAQKEVSEGSLSRAFIVLVRISLDLLFKPTRAYSRCLGIILRASLAQEGRGRCRWRRHYSQV